MDTTAIDHLLSTTPAVRLRLDLERDVEPEVLAECLRLALHAPTPRSTPTWRWLVVRDPDLRRRVGALFREVGTDYLRRKVAATGEAARHGALARAIASAQHLVDVIDRVPVFVIPCVLGRPQGDNAADAVLYGGIFPAVWSFQLALRARGLGSTLTTYHLEREAEAAAILGIPDDVTQVALLPVAYATTTDFKPVRRGPLEEGAHLDTWGAPLR